MIIIGYSMGLNNHLHVQNLTRNGKKIILCVENFTSKEKKLYVKNFTSK